jgi:hypothetical protein
MSSYALHRCSRTNLLALLLFACTGLLSHIPHVAAGNGNGNGNGNIGNFNGNGNSGNNNGNNNVGNNNGNHNVTDNNGNNVHGDNSGNGKPNDTEQAEFAAPIELMFPIGEIPALAFPPFNDPFGVTSSPELPLFPEGGNVGDDNTLDIYPEIELY